MKKLILKEIPSSSSEHKMRAFRCMTYLEISHDIKRAYRFIKKVDSIMIQDIPLPQSRNLLKMVKNLEVSSIWKMYNKSAFQHLISLKVTDLSYKSKKNLVNFAKIVECSRTLTSLREYLRDASILQFLSRRNKLRFFEARIRNVNKIHYLKTPILDKNCKISFLSITDDKLYTLIRNDDDLLDKIVGIDLQNCFDESHNVLSKKIKNLKSLSAYEIVREFFDFTNKFDFLQALHLHIIFRDVLVFLTYSSELPSLNHLDLSISMDSAESTNLSEQKNLENEFIKVVNVVSFRLNWIRGSISDGNIMIKATESMLKKFGKQLRKITILGRNNVGNMYDTKIAEIFANFDKLEMLDLDIFDLDSEYDREKIDICQIRICQHINFKLIRSTFNFVKLKNLHFFLAEQILDDTLPVFLSDLNVCLIAMVNLENFQLNLLFSISEIEFLMLVNVVKTLISLEKLSEIRISSNDIFGESDDVFGEYDGEFEALLKLLKNKGEKYLTYEFEFGRHVIYNKKKYGIHVEIID